MAGGRAAVRNAKSGVGQEEVGIARWMSIWRGWLGGGHSRMEFLAKRLTGKDRMMAGVVPTIVDEGSHQTNPGGSGGSTSDG